MSLQNRNEKDVKNFYEESTLEKALENHPPEISQYLAREEEYLHSVAIGLLDRRGGPISIIDIGCGTGRVLKLLDYAANKAVGVDFARRQTLNSRKQAPYADIFQGDAAKLPFKEESFDCVICAFNSLGNFVNGKRDALSEMGRIVKGDGRLVVSVYSESVLDIQKKYYIDILEKKIESITEDAVYLQDGLISERFSKDKLQNLFRSAGLYGEIKELTPISYICEVRKSG